MRKTITVNIDDMMRYLSDEDILDEMVLRGYFVKEIEELRKEPVPNLLKLSDWAVSCGMGK